MVGVDGCGLASRGSCSSKGIGQEFVTFPYFLDVERSVLGRPWRPRLDGAGEAQALAIAQVSGQST